MDQHDPVEDAEFVYRRIHRSFCDAAISPPIRSEAFRPNSNNDTGLSVFRAHFVQPQLSIVHTPSGESLRPVEARAGGRPPAAIGWATLPSSLFS
jgi:hypothetical protein